jgi:hypothetical protein
VTKKRIWTGQKKMPYSKQTHIFATRLDLVPGLSKVEADLEIKYARCGTYAGKVFEKYSSLLEWADLGKNTTGNHLSGAQFLVVLKSQEINLEALPEVGASDLRSPQSAPSRVVTVDRAGKISASSLSLEEALLSVEDSRGYDVAKKPAVGDTYVLSQKLNPDSIIFIPGGIYNEQPALVAGHIGTISDSVASLSLYKAFNKAILKKFEKIRSYHVGPEAADLMQRGYRMVTIGIGSSSIYDLQRP